LAVRGELHFKAFGLKRIMKKSRFESGQINSLAGFFFFSMMLRLTG
jgi:hypothetical protein